MYVTGVRSDHGSFAVVCSGIRILLLEYSALFSPHIAFHQRGFYGWGGIEQVVVNLLQSYRELGLRLDLVLSEVPVVNCHLARIPSSVRLIDLKAKGFVSSTRCLMNYLRRERPLALLSTHQSTNVSALLARRLLCAPTRIVVSEHGGIRENQEMLPPMTRLMKHSVMRMTYPMADGIVAVSEGLAQATAIAMGMPSSRIKVIYNPVVSPKLLDEAKEAVDDSWLRPGQPPVVLGVGRLAPQKDFSTLIRAFAEVRRKHSARLMILGEGNERPMLQSLIEELCLAQDARLVGFIANPLAYMARSAVLAVSSRWEGLCNVIVEALLVGTQVVSTDCKSGPTEILDGGKYGFLVPVGDSGAMAAAIMRILSGERKSLERSWLERFSVASAAAQYLSILLPDFSAKACSDGKEISSSGLSG